MNSNFIQLNSNIIQPGGIMLKAIISSKTKRKLLTLLLINPKRRFYIRELSMDIKENINSVWCELKKLFSIGLVFSEKRSKPTVL